MPKINGPDVSKGFWTALGVAAALLVLSIVTMILQQFRRSKG